VNKLAQMNCIREWVSIR